MFHCSKTKITLPYFREHIDFVEIGSPLSVKTYLGQPHGDFYGVNHMRERFDPTVNAILRSETEVCSIITSSSASAKCKILSTVLG